MDTRVMYLNTTGFLIFKNFL